MQLPTEMFENSRELSVPRQLFPTKKTWKNGKCITTYKECLKCPRENGLSCVPRITFGNDVKIALLKKYKKEKSL
jgi:hypothetical protein